MARVKQFDVITGSIANLSFYTRKGSNQVFVRTKGGATKSQIKRRPEFANTRRNNKEFGGCSKMSKEIRMSFFGLQQVADFNLAPALCSLVKNIQKADLEGAWGERSIRLSAHKQYLVGFDFNRIVRFDSVLRVPLQWTINRETTLATINIPAFACSMGLNSPNKYNLFRISAAFGVATDYRLGERKYDYEPVHDTIGLGGKITSSNWFSTQTTVAEQVLELQLKLNRPEITFNESDTLILTVAIEFGAMDAFGNPTPVKGAGAGKILGVG